MSLSWHTRPVIPFFVVLRAESASDQVGLDAPALVLALGNPGRGVDADDVDGAGPPKFNEKPDISCVLAR